MRVVAFSVRGIRVFTAVLTISFQLFTYSQARTATAKGMAPIVHQNDLDGWQVDGTISFEECGVSQPVWTIVDGEIRCAGRGFGYLRYNRRLTDFVVSLEFKVVANTNSGIGIRGIKYSGKKKTRPSTAGFEVQILDDAGQPPSTHASGSLYRYVAPQKNAIKKAGEWNRYVITCQGTRLVVELNGEVVQDFDQRSLPATSHKPLSGYLSLQNHGGPIIFRNVCLKQL